MIDTSLAENGSSIDLGTLTERLAEKDIILFGEDHSKEVILKNQKNIIKSLYHKLKDKGKSLILALEHFATTENEIMWLSMLYDPAKRDEAIHNLARLHESKCNFEYVKTRDRIPEEFGKYVLPLLDLTLDYDPNYFSIRPLADPSMRGHTGSSEIWNKSMKKTTLEMHVDGNCVFDIIGLKHIVYPDYEGSLPHLVVNHEKRPKVAVVTQKMKENNINQKGVILPVFNLPCEAYELSGSLR